MSPSVPSDRSFAIVARSQGDGSREINDASRCNARGIGTSSQELLIHEKPSCGPHCLANRNARNGGKQLSISGSTTQGQTHDDAHAREKYIRILEQENRVARRKIAELTSKNQENLRNMDMQYQTAQQQIMDLQDYINNQQAQFAASLNQEKQRCENTQELLEEKMKELKGAQEFLNYSDTLSGADVIALVKSLNTEIHQTAALVADTAKFDCNYRKDYAWKDVASTAQETLGESLFEAIESRYIRRGSELYPTLVQLALQTCIVNNCSDFVDNWDFRRSDHKLRILYRHIQRKEKVVVSRKWRMLTRKYLNHDDDADKLFKVIKDDVSAVLIVAGSSESAVASIDDRASVICNLALRLRTAISEGITSADFYPLVFEAGCDFDPSSMEPTYDDRNGQFQDAIMGTTELGLMQRINLNEKNVLMKTKVFFLSSLQSS